MGEECIAAKRRVAILREHWDNGIKDVRTTSSRREENGERGERRYNGLVNYSKPAMDT